MRDVAEAMRRIYYKGITGQMVVGVAAVVVVATGSTHVWIAVRLKELLGQDVSYARTLLVRRRRGVRRAFSQGHAGHAEVEGRGGSGSLGAIGDVV